MHEEIVAAFDFDGTITDRDTLLPFLHYTFGTWPCFFCILSSIPIFLGWVVGMVSRQGVKETLLSHFFSGVDLEVVQQYAERFAERKLPSYVKAEAVQRLRWHQKHHHRCVLVSASIENYLRPWASSMGFHDVIASQLAIDKEGRVTGKLKGKNCRGEEKIQRLEALLGPKQRYTLFAYGDSRGDAELLALADYPYYRLFPVEENHKTIQNDFGRSFSRYSSC